MVNGDDADDDAPLSVLDHGPGASYEPCVARASGVGKGPGAYGPDVGDRVAEENPYGVCGCGAWRCRDAPVGPDAPVVGIDSVGIDVVGTDSVGWDMDDAGMGDVGITDDGTTGDGSVGMTFLYDSYCGSP